MTYPSFVLTAIITLTWTATVPRAIAQENGGTVGNNNLQCSAAAVERLINDIAKLRGELRQLKIDQHQLRIASLERELQHAKADRLRAEAQQDLLRQDIAEVDEQLNQPLDAQSYARLLNVKTAIVGEGYSANSTEQQKARQREEEAATLLKAERQRLQDLSR
jgi:hypothetical protein